MRTNLENIVIGATYSWDWQFQRDANGYAMMIDCANKSGLKAIANITWVSTIWTDYYGRKANVLSGNYSDGMNFDNNGNMPYSFYEAYSEVYN